LELGHNTVMFGLKTCQGLSPAEIVEGNSGGAEKFVELLGMCFV